MPLILHGYEFSVYAWVARFALHAKGIDYTWREIDPFDDPIKPDYLKLHPFGRVPTLMHDPFVLYETVAITRYVDEAFPGPTLQPASPTERARMAQVISIVDNYAYWPLVRQVFSHGFWREREGEVADPKVLAEGLSAAPRVLQALDELTTGTDALVSNGLTLADIHLAPMISYFCETAEGHALLHEFQALDRWWMKIRLRDAFISSRPNLDRPAGHITP